VNKKIDEPIEISSMTYEEAYDELARIVESLEEGEHTLEKLIDLFERGKNLSNYCKDLLNIAELKIKDINGEEFNSLN